MHPNFPQNTFFLKCLGVKPGASLKHILMIFIENLYIFIMKRTEKKVKDKYFSKLYDIQEKLIKPCSLATDKWKGLHKQNKFQEFNLYSSKTSDDSICFGGVCRLKLKWFMDWTRRFFLSCFLEQSGYQYANQKKVLLFQSFINELNHKQKPPAMKWKHSHTAVNN